VLALAFAAGLALPVVAVSHDGPGAGAANKPCNSTTHPAKGRPPCPPTTGTSTTPSSTTTTTTTTTSGTGTTSSSPTTATGGSTRTTSTGPPVAGESVLASVTAGSVSVRPPGAAAFVPLRGARTVPIGSVLDARHGQVTLRTENGAGLQTGHFSYGIFKVTQSRSVPSPKARTARAARPRLITILRLTGGSFAACRTATTASIASARPRHRRKVVRKLWSAEGGGSWSSVGGDAAATVRGTVWLTEDLCTGTYVYVKRGVVVVDDFATGRHVRLTAGHSYLAKAPARGH
jgi:hypothetical protein